MPRIDEDDDALPTEEERNLLENLQGTLREVAKEKKASSLSIIMILIGIGVVVASTVYSGRIISEINQSKDELARMNEQLRESEYQLSEKERRIAERDKQNEALLLTCPQSVLEQAANTNPALKIAVQNIEKLKKSATPTPSASATPILPVDPKQKNPDFAKQKELEGFQYLNEDKYDLAIQAFQASENAFNGWNNVYELGRILRINKNDMKEKKCDVFKKIAKDYTWHAPETELKRIRNFVAANCK